MWVQTQFNFASLTRLILNSPKDEYPNMLNFPVTQFQKHIDQISNQILYSTMSKSSMLKVLKTCIRTFASYRFEQNICWITYQDTVQIRTDNALPVEAFFVYSNVSMCVVLLNSWNDSRSSISISHFMCLNMTATSVYMDTIVIHSHTNP